MVIVYFQIIGTNNFFVEPETSLIIGKQFEPTIIPCKPTSPEVKLEMFDHNRKIMKLPYDPQKGFTIVSNESVHDKTLTCIALSQAHTTVSNSTDNERNFIIKIAVNCKF